MDFNSNDSFRSLDDFANAVYSKDLNVRQDTFFKLEEYLKNDYNRIDCSNLPKFCDAILEWVNCSNFKVSINGLTILQLLIQRQTEQLRGHSIEIVTMVIERLADSKEQVRFACKTLLIFMMACYTPGYIWEKLMGSFGHKLPKVREELLFLLDDTLNRFGIRDLQYSKILTLLVKLSTDQSQAVRDKSFQSLIELYRYVGENLRVELRKKQLPEAKLKLYLNKFDDVLKNGELKVEAKNSSKPEPNEFNSASSCASLPPSNKSNKMIPSSRSNMASLSSAAAAGSRNAPGNSGAVDEDVFLNAFENVPKIQVYSSRDVDQHMSQINDCLADLNNDWEKRVDSLKRIRSLAIACQNQYDDEFFAALKQISVSFTLQIKDLRSQIVREACITIAFLARLLGHRLESFTELAMTHLINLIQNSAKVMATSGTIAIRFIIEHTHSTRLIPLIAGGISSRSKEIRRCCTEFLNQLLQTWETHTLDKHVQLIQTCIKKAIVDADQEARVFARKAFWSFSSHYPSLADSLLLTLDTKTQKLLQTGSQGAFGSVKSLKDGTSSYTGTSSINYDYMDSQNNRMMMSSKQVAASNLNTQAQTPTSRIKRSTSAVDIKNTRSNSVITGSRIPIGVGDSATSTRTASSRIPTSINQPTPRAGQSAYGGVGSSRIAHSQPGSRSTSPTPKYSYLTHLNNSGLNNSITASTGPSSRLTGLTSSAIKSKIPTSSRNSSRESSPGRRSSFGGDRRSSFSKATGRRLFSKQLVNNTDSEQAIAVAMANKYPRRRWEDSDDASETSSICSERSFSSSIGGTRVTEDMNEAITCLSSSQWSERRDGLINLKNMMLSGRIFTRQEIKRLCEIFSRLFQDQHVKVFTLFLDALNEFIRTYKRDLKEWLYVLLTRLLAKLGVESLSTVYSRLCTCLEAVRSSFDLDLQFKILIQYIKDISSQTTNLKVKVAVLKYLQDIICLMEPVDFHTTEDLKYAVCKIVALTAEPKSVDIRKTSQAVLVALFNLNTPEFSMLLSDLPKNIQETASRILRNHIKNLSQENCNTSSTGFSPSSAGDFKYKSTTSPGYFNEYINSINGNGYNNGSSSSRTDDSGTQLSHVIKDIQNLNMSSNSHHLLHTNGTTNGNYGYKNEKLIDTMSKDSGVQSNGDVDSDSDGATSITTNTSSSTSNLPNINQIISVLSSDIKSNTLGEHLRSMKDLTELIKAGNRPECKWNENFKNILLCLFNHLDATSLSTTSENSNTNNNSNSSNVEQALALQTLMALRELLQFHYKEFANYIELTIMKLIEKYRESPPSDSSKLVEEVICTAARCLPPEPCARVLKPLIEKAEYPKNLIAIRMMQKTIDHMDPDLCTRLLPDILNALLIAWDSQHSPVRKAAVFCLVSIYLVIGETLRQNLTNLSSSKIKLLNVYINRAKESKDPNGQLVN